MRGRCELKFHPDEVQGLMGWIKSAKTASDTLVRSIARAAGNFHADVRLVSTRSAV